MIREKEEWVTVDEWIAEELHRIEQQQAPRHCQDYEALIEMIEEISRAPSLTGAFLSLLDYCWNHPSPHHPCPILLLMQMEQLLSLTESDEIHAQLHPMISIQTPTHTSLFSPCHQIQQWAQSLLCMPPDEQSHRLHVGINAYHHAKSSSLSYRNDSHRDVTQTIHHLEQLMEQSHIQ